MMLPDTRKMVLSLFVLGVCAIWLGYEAYSHSATRKHPETVTSIMSTPDFTWKAFDGSSHTLAELNGHPVVLHFWATWCEPCRAEFPTLIKAAKQAGSNIIFLTVSSDKSLDKAKDFIADMTKQSGAPLPANMLFAFDPQKALTFDVFQTLEYPETILLDSGHHLRMKFPGMVDWKNEKVIATVQQLQQ